MSKEQLCQVQIRRKEPDGLWQVVTESGFTPEILRQGVLMMDGGDLLKLRNDFAIPASVRDLEGGFLPCTRGNSWLHFLASQIGWDREDILDYFGIDYTGGEMTGFRFDLSDYGEIKQVDLKAEGYIGDASYAALRLLPYGYNIMTNRRILVASSVLSRESEGGRDPLNLMFTISTPYNSASVRVTRLDYQKAMRVLNSAEDTKFFVFDFIEPQQF